MPPIQGRPVDHKLPDVLAAIEKGITISGTALVLKCTRNTVRSHCKRWPSVQAAIDEHRQELVDLAEMGLRGAVLKQEAWALTFTLRTLARHIYNDEGNPPGPDLPPVKYIVLEPPRARADRNASLAEDSTGTDPG